MKAIAQDEYGSCGWARRHDLILETAGNRSVSPTRPPERGGPAPVPAGAVETRLAAFSLGVKVA